MTLPEGLMDDGDFLRGPLKLPTWVGLASESRAKAPVIELAVEPDDHDRSATPAQDAAIAMLTTDRGLRGVVLGALLEHYRAIRPKWLAHLPSPDAMPELREPTDLIGRIDVREAVVHRIERDGMAYIGLLFGCTWDQEHGLGVMLHRDRVVKCGGADTGLLGWIAMRDLEPARRVATPAGKKAAPPKQLVPAKPALVAKKVAPAAKKPAPTATKKKR